MRLKNVGFLYGGLTGKAGDDFNVEDDNESYMLFIPFTNIFNNSIINPNQLYKVKVSNDENQNLVQKNDLLFLMSSEDYDGIGKPAILEDSIDNLGLNSFSKGLRITNQDIYPKFLFYYLSSHVSRELVRREAKGFIRINLRQDRLHCCKIILPAIHEQQAIASFLDKKCVEIDSLITLQEEMIVELQAYKQSVITETVTKGLDSNAKMKDSGVEWIGEIPEDWKVCKIKNLFRLSTGTTPKSFEDIIEGEETINWYTPSDIIDGGNELWKSQRKLSKRIADNEKIKVYPKHSLIYVGIGATAGKVGYSHEVGYCNQQITALIPKGDGNKYFYYLLNAISVMIRDNAYFTTLPIINNSYLGQCEIPSPPISEQQAIVSYLDEKTAQIDALILLKQEKIAELKDYKKSIIYEYVTGKKIV